MTLALPIGRNMIILPRLLATRRGLAGASLDPAWPAKDPADLVIYGADFLWVFGGLPPAFVLAQVSSDDALLVVDQAIIGTAFVLQIAGGVDGSPATILLTATCGNGQVAARAVTLPIVGNGALLDADTPISAVGTVAPAGSSQADATPIQAASTMFTGGVPGGGGVLQPWPGQCCLVLNRTGSGLLVYPPPNGTIEGGAQNTPVTVDPGAAATFVTKDGLSWFAT